MSGNCTARGIERACHGMSSGCRRTGRSRRAAPRPAAAGDRSAEKFWRSVGVERVGSTPTVGKVCDRQMVRTRSFRSKSLSTKCRQGVEQFGVGRRVGLAHVVFGIDQAAAEEVLPVAVDQRPGEERVVLASSSSRPAARAGHRRAQRRAGRRPGRPASPPARSWGCVADGRPRLWKMTLTRPAPSPSLRPTVREERRQAVVVLLAPLLERMMVALGALHAACRGRAGPCPRHSWPGSFTWRYQATAGVCVHVAGGGQHLAHELVVRLVRVRLSRIQSWKAKVAALVGLAARRLLRSSALHLLAK